MKVNGSPLPNEAAADLIKISVLDDVDAPGMFAITIVAWDYDADEGEVDR